MQIGAKTKRFSIQHIVGKFVFPAQKITAMDLGKSCKSGTYIMTPPLLLCVQREILYQKRAGTYNRHISA